jgi:hypothetical protein
MEKRTQRRLVLASASIASISGKCIRDILLFAGSTQRDISKPITSVIDANTKTLALTGQAVFHIGVEQHAFLYSVKSSFKRYVQKCRNLEAIHLIFPSIAMIFGPQLCDFIRELVLLAPPTLQRVQTYECNNWLVQTSQHSFSAQFYQSISPSIHLSVSDVLQIVQRSVMAMDRHTLTLFGMSQGPNDFHHSFGIVRVSDFVEYSAQSNRAKGCLHCISSNGRINGVRRVVLKKNQAGVWKVVMIGKFIACRRCDMCV